ncbi:MAG: DNA-processing protein DprA [Rhodospirillaceae bacterium]|nr:DNA-processing protein DprA [Rhodospirillaceae bacterium]
MDASEIQPSSLSDDERTSWLRLIRTENVGPVTFYKLLEQFGTASAALAALPELSGRGGRKIKAASKSSAEREMEALAKLGGTLICRADDAYSPLLAQVEDAPPVISLLGHPHLLKKRTIAIVGARNASINGQNFARSLAGELGENGFLVISGMARGVDTAAHEGALGSGTIAVVAGGVDVVYPKQNQGLYERLITEGAIMSEIELGTQPQARHFPRRNRIISGAARGTVVVEAGLKSGSLITARMALEQGREVFAVPGSPLDPRSAGANRMIKEGAQLTESAEDIFEALESLIRRPLEERKPLEYKGKLPDPPDVQQTDEARVQIIALLSPSAVTVDELVRSCQFSVAIVSLVLLELELAGRLERYAGNRVALISQR